ncbi:MAG: hypothetical protein A2921_02955 [Candidatus Magasanikbacteria bacterium RIFCSPLOWO2_01_FULL_43_20b]|uniref:Dipeptidylpeptidase IV N-terminal domain-containing protein n=1 Tax=Candidatus Magasanikbacteria bacterium RIFCSPLOWO2_12_FULL_43_12 TaxID=1798692 RepID=A0A1F6MVP0_9BACT|nr:MAG: hypothetical protein A3C74_03260 [Candidatus Magasanikbacteria bacterium RIFCSPHIGHO2_02_FULL_44_13]OGH72624.1 MAG: hypothetical protein A3I93_01845 [Candidatus Magasanikbacteria bacterium RIFCSPLOWO2_02_FULL_43_22]OGH73594.1 MAG: hypothetical protein A2921_02955 [Candidatus Magasanikbacteria bacterium RIFCSPLOWO2_01_FULL_43_20b]OGH75560.1 MAG: hypothetical protein A3G00_00665 [Candidatus Magasanikbacteria bacterium RIFCSPLOWO2_12_FULL_43_12]
MDKKRIIYAGIFLVVCVAVGFLLYWVFFAKKEKPITAVQPGVEAPAAGLFPTAGSGEPTLPTSKPGQLPTSVSKPITPKTVTPEVKPSFPITNKVDSSILGSGKDTVGSAKFYNTTDGKFYRLNKDGSIAALSDEVFFNVQNATWSPTKNESVIEYPDGSNIYYNFDTKKQVTLPKHWQDFSFSPFGDKIASKSMGLATENRWLVTADPEGKSIKLIAPLGENADKVTVNWSPNKQIVATSATGDPQGADKQEILFVGLQGENFRSIIVEGRGFESQWSTSGKKLLYSVYSARSNFKPELWIVNAEGDSIGTGRKMLNLNTWSEKCAFTDDRFIYCAVPTQMQTGAGFAPGLADTTNDKIYKIDTETGIKTELTTDGYHTVDSLFIGDNNKTIYFTDKNSSGLFSVPI